MRIRWTNTPAYSGLPSILFLHPPSPSHFTSLPRPPTSIASYYASFRIFLCISSYLNFANVVPIIDVNVWEEITHEIQHTKAKMRNTIRATDGLPASPPPPLPPFPLLAQVS